MELGASEVAEQNEAETEPSKQPRRFYTKETAIEFRDIAMAMFEKTAPTPLESESKQRDL
jgi:hypothetical protein